MRRTVRLRHVEWRVEVVRMGNRLGLLRHHLLLLHRGLLNHIRCRLIDWLHKVVALIHNRHLILIHGLIHRFKLSVAPLRLFWLSSHHKIVYDWLELLILQLLSRALLGCNLLFEEGCKLFIAGRFGTILF